MAAHPDRMKVSPARPRNSASRRRSRWPGLVQSAKPRWPPTDAMRGALAMSCGVAAESTSWAGVGMAGSVGLRGNVGRGGAGEREGVDDAVVEFFGDAVGEGGLFEGGVVVDGVVGDF